MSQPSSAQTTSKKKNRLFILIALIILILILLFSLSMCGKGPSTQNQGDPLVFEDPVFEQAVKTSLNKGSNDSVYTSDLSEIKTLSIIGDTLLMYKSGEEQKRLVFFFGTAVEIDGVRQETQGTLTSLADLKHFPNLALLTVALQKNIDFSTIKAIPNVHYLHIYGSDVDTLDFVKYSNILTTLDVDYHQITTLDALKDSTKLKRVSVAFGPLEDIEGLKDCVLITDLDLSENNVTDISALEKLTALEELYLRENNITDISVVANLKELTFLGLSQNNISDVSPIASLEKLTRIMLADNPVSNMESISKYEDIIE